MQENISQFDQILKQFSTGDQLNDFLKTLQNEALKSYLKASSTVI